MGSLACVRSVRWDMVNALVMVVAVDADAGSAKTRMSVFILCG